MKQLSAAYDEHTLPIEFDLTDGAGNVFCRLDAEMVIQRHLASGDWDVQLWRVGDVDVENSPTALYDPAHDVFRRALQRNYDRNEDRYCAKIRRLFAEADADAREAFIEARDRRCYK